MERAQSQLETRLREMPLLPSMISLGGYALVHAGIDRGLDTEEGTALVIAGRAADVADGYVARKFNMESPEGAFIDPTLDKLGMLKIVNNLYDNGIIPAWVRDGMILQNTANTIATFATKQKHPETDLRPTKSGKLAMATQGASLACFNVGHHLQERNIKSAKYFRAAGHALAAAGIVYFGGKATHEYVQRI